MSFSIENPMQKKFPPWSDEEHNILVEMTNEQIELEAKDPSRVISWPEHWANVTESLRKHGYSRTEGACRTFSRRLMESQDLNPRDTTALPESINRDDSQPNKRHLPQEGISSEEDPSPPLKKHRWKDIVCAVQNNDVRLLVLSD